MAEYRFTDEQKQLRDAVRKFSADHFAEEKIRQLMESDPPFDPKVWARLGGELGVLGLSVPEADGGVGGTLVDQAVAIEELGARLACGPLFGTVYLAIPALVAASSGAARDELLGDLDRGTAHRGRRGGGPGRCIRSGCGHGDRRGRRGVGHGHPGGRRWHRGRPAGRRARIRRRRSVRRRRHSGRGAAHATGHARPHPIRGERHVRRRARDA